MSEIHVGDLVMVVRGHECDVGRIFQVDGLSMDSWYCENCGAETFDDELVAEHIEDDCVYPITWLRRLDPDALKDDLPIKEELHA